MSRTQHIFLSLIGFVAAVLILILLIIYLAIIGEARGVVAVVLFGSSVAILHLFHIGISFFKEEEIRPRLYKFNQVFSFVLIALSYAPLYLFILKGAWGWSLFGVSLGLAFLGIILRLCFTGNLGQKLSEFVFFVLDWLVVIAFVPLHSLLSVDNLKFLTLGSLFYTLSLVLERNYLNSFYISNHFSIPRLSYLCLIFGSVSHFIFILRAL